MFDMGECVCIYLFELAISIFAVVFNKLYRPSSSNFLRKLGR